MFRNAFNEPKPANHEELEEAIDELGLNPAECSVVITDNSGDAFPFDGWTAEIVGEDLEEELITLETGAWSNQADLRNDLKAARFKTITVA